jgi:hypothetical protein
MLQVIGSFITGTVDSLISGTVVRLYYRTVLRGYRGGIIGVDSEGRLAPAGNREGEQEPWHG